MNCATPPGYCVVIWSRCGHGTPSSVSVKLRDRNHRSHGVQKRVLDAPS